MHAPGRFLGPALAALAALVATVAVACVARPQHLAPALSFGPASALVAAGLYDEARQRPFSLHAMHLLFVAVFFVAAPLVQVLAWSFPVLDVAPFAVTLGLVLGANAAIFLWLTLYLLAYQRAPRSRAAARTPPIQRRGIVWPLVSASAALGVLAYLGTFGVVTRSGFEAVRAASVTDSGISLIVATFVRAVPFGSIAVIILRRSYRRPIGAVALAALIVACLLLDNPLASARFSTAAVGIGFVCITVLRRRRTGALLVGALLVGNLMLMPMLDAGRNAETGSEFLEGVLLERDGASRFTSGDFDAYAMLLSAQQYTDDVGVTWGRQALGVALFWVPRSWWPSKPVGSGHEIASHYRFRNDNLSCPLPAEGLLNFGILGLATFAAAWGAALRRVDDAYWNEPGTRIQAVYPFMLGVVFFVSRGDLLSGFAYATGIALGLAAPALSFPEHRNRPRRQARRGTAGVSARSHRFPPHPTA